MAALTVRRVGINFQLFIPLVTAVQNARDIGVQARIFRLIVSSA